MAPSATNNISVHAATNRPAMLQGTVKEIIFINFLFLLVCYLKLQWNPKKETARREFHLILDVFLRYTLIFTAISIVLKLYNQDMARAFIGTGLYHAAYTLHSYIAFRDSPSQISK